MAMKRIKAWEQSLVAFTTSCLRTPYAWGLHDCCVFAANCVKATTGEDFAEEFRGRYDTETGAYQLLANLGYATIADLVSSRLEEITNDGKPAPLLARRGDIVMLPVEKNATGDALGVCDGLSLIGPRAPRGIAHISMLHASRAWRVG